MSHKATLHDVVAGSVTVILGEVSVTCPTDSLSHFCPKFSVCPLQKTFTDQVCVSFRYCVVVVTVSP